MVHTDTHGSMVLFADVQERNENFASIFFSSSALLLVSVLQVFERASWVNIVAWIDTYLLTRIMLPHQGREP